jgi:hypothetical protein
VTNVRPVAAHVQRDGDHPVGEGAALQGSRRPRRNLSWAFDRSTSALSGPRSSVAVGLIPISVTRQSLAAGLGGARVLLFRSVCTEVGVAWPVRQQIWLFRRAHRVGRASGPMVPRESGTTALPVGAPGGGGMEVQRRSSERRRGEEAGHERDAGRKGGPGHRWRIRDRPRQCFGAWAGRQLPSTSSRHRAGQSVSPTASPSTPTASPSTPSSASQ